MSGRQMDRRRKDIMNRPTRRNRRPHRAVAALTALMVTAIIGVGIVACTASVGVMTLPSNIPDLASNPNDNPWTEENGYIAVGESVSPFDDHLPTIANLDPDLLAAVQAATVDANNDGVEMVVTSGWRSASYQQALLDEATVTYGSLDEARKWVNTPELSAHVPGNAVDIGYTDANSWLSIHGADYGLCQIYGNEMWHFELATEPGGTCPQMKDDAAG